MIEILVITHGNFGKEIVESSKLIIGEQTNYKTIGLFHGDNIEEFKQKVCCMIENLGSKDDGVLVFVDINGGSPFNAVAMSMYKLTEKTNFECIIGINFPIILEAFMMRDSLSLKELKEHCLHVGKSSIKDLKKEFITN